MAERDYVSYFKRRKEMRDLPLPMKDLFDAGEYLAKDFTVIGPREVPDAPSATSPLEASFEATTAYSHSHDGEVDNSHQQQCKRKQSVADPLASLAPEPGKRVTRQAALNQGISVGIPQAIPTAEDLFSGATDSRKPDPETERLATAFRVSFSASSRADSDSLLYAYSSQVTVGKALKAEDSAHWKRAIKLEIDTLINGGTLEETEYDELEAVRDVLHSTMQLKKKTLQDGGLDKYKARLCACGNELYTVK
jgi:hypothetical protein